MMLCLTEVVLVTRPLLKELYEHFAKIEEILATLEELANKEGLERIERSLQEYKKKEYVAVKRPEDVRAALMKN